MNYLAANVDINFSNINATSNEENLCKFVNITFQYWNNSVSYQVFDECPGHLEEFFKTTTHPTTIPTIVPSNYPSLIPSTPPSIAPSNMPSGIPSSIPSGTPSSAPSSIPSLNPSSTPSNVPTMDSSLMPTYASFITSFVAQPTRMDTIFVATSSYTPTQMLLSEISTKSPSTAQSDDSSNNANTQGDIIAIIGL